MKFALLLILPIASCSFHESTQSINGGIRLKGRSDLLGVSSKQEQNNLTTKELIIIYRLSDSHSGLPVMTNTRQKTMLHGINPWSGGRFGDRGIWTFNTGSQLMEAVALSTSESRLIYDFVNNAISNQEEPNISSVLYNKLPRFKEQKMTNKSQ